MNPRLTIASALLALLTIAPDLAAAQASKPEASEIRSVLADAVDDFIRPAYARLEDSAGRLRKTVGELCDAPDRPRLTSARETFGVTLEAWSRVEPIRFGPILGANAAERLYFFPDRRGIGLRQVQAVLAEKDEAAASPESLAAKSVALQGLGALEFLLFGTDADELAADSGAFRCRFAEAVSTRVEATAGEVADQWAAPEGVAHRFVDPDPSNADFKTEEDSLRALLGVFTNGLEMVADTRIAPFLGKDAASARPKVAPWWRSGLTGRALAANLAGLSDLFERSGMERLLPQANENLPAEIRFEFANAQRAIETAGAPLPEVAAKPESRSPVDYLLIVTRSLRSLFADRLAGAMGLAAGFSSLDGD